MFRPLAFTKTFALLASVVVAITMIPAFAHLLFAGRARGWLLRTVLHGGLAAAGVALAVAVSWWMGLIVAGIGAYHLAEARLPERARAWARRSANWIAVAAVALLLTSHWLPLGPDKGLWLNLAFVGLLVGGLLGFYLLFQHFYGSILRWCLAHKLAFLSIPAAILVMGAFAWLGFERVLGWLPDRAKAFGPVSAVAHRFPGLGNEFMPPLDEGSFLYMPTTMPHAGVGEALDILRKQDAAIDRVPEVDSVVGKIGRAETAIDPAPMSMVETVINYKPEYLSDRAGRRLAFSFEPAAQDYFRNEEGVPVAAPDGQPYIVRGRFPRDSIGRLIPERGGRPFRLWRPALDPALNPGRSAWQGIRSPDDIWNRIVAAADVPGSTSAPKLQPIAARIVMLQSGIRAQMGVRIQGPDLETVEKAGLEIERLLKEVPSVEPSTVFADRITGKAYLNIVPDRQAIGRYGIRLGDVQRVIETALGGDRITTTVEGRERYPVRVRYLRELRDSFEELGRILVPAPDASQIPLAQLARIDYARSPEVIRTEDTFLVGYVLFDMKPGNAEVDVVAACRRHLEERLAPAEGVKWTFTGSYESQQRAAATLRLIVPVSLFSIFLILYFQFRSVATSLLVFAGVAVSWAGGFVMVWLCSQAWFMNFALFGADMRELFHIHPVNMSVAVWVGFLALFGISDDDGVVIATYLDDSFGRRRPSTVPELREATVAAGKRRIRACLMTTATTVLALLPVFTSTGRGSDLMAPMAIPAFGGMAFEVITMLIVPVLYCLVAEIRLSTRK